MAAESPYRTFGGMAFNATAKASAGECELGGPERTSRLAPDVGHTRHCLASAVQRHQRNRGRQGEHRLLDLVVRRPPRRRIGGRSGRGAQGGVECGIGDLREVGRAAEVYAALRYGSGVGARPAAPDRKSSCWFAARSVA